MIKTFLLVGVLMYSLPAAWAFSLIGPVNNGDDAWQSQANGFNAIQWTDPLGFVDALPVGPKNLGDGYRQNTPVQVYAFSPTFLKFFGSNGVVAVDNAYVILNNAFTNNSLTGQFLTNGVDSYSYAATEFPLNSQRQNFHALNWGLLDVKSFAMTLMMQQLGLADSMRYAWVLHDRYTPPGSTCVTEPGGSGTGGYIYLVVQRNYDIVPNPLYQPNLNAAEVKVQYSAYVNGSVLSYQIVEYCNRSPDPAPLTADAMEVYDPLTINPPVASGLGSGYLPYGTFYTGLTRDDAAGLRYLMSSNNINTESPDPAAQLEDTNNPTTLLTTSDLGALVTNAQTNSPAVLATLFPGVQVGSSFSYFTNISSPNIITFTTNYYGEPYGTPPHIITVTNGFTNAIVQWYVTSFANVVTNSYRTNSTATLQTTTFGAPVGSPVGSPFVAKTSSKQVNLTNTPTGDYYLIPAGSCGLNVVKVWQTNVVSTTNLLTFAINPDGSFITQSLVTRYTNHVLEVLPCNFVAPTPRLYQGVQKLKFVRGNYDSLLGQNFLVQTNTYTMVVVTNNQAVRQTFQRVVTAPDYLFDAADISPGPTANPVTVQYNNGITFGVGSVPAGSAGPGTIVPGVTFVLNKVGTIYINQAPDFVNGPIYQRDYLWGSFDSSTNIVVYPDGTSIANLQAEVLMQIYPATLPSGTLNVVYPTVTLSATGGQTPYTWSGSGLPPGLNLDPGTGALSGTPSVSGVYPVTVLMTDHGGRTVGMRYTLTIN